MSKRIYRSRPIGDRFWEKVQRTETCWLWTAGKTPNGYGSFYAENSSGSTRRSVLAHRFAYRFLVGPIPLGMVIDHICHNPACVNPEHLRAITQRQNMQNRAGLSVRNKSGYHGVTWSKDKAKWLVTAKGPGGRQVHGGYFESLEEANLAAIALRNRLYTHNDMDRLVAS